MEAGTHIVSLDLGFAGEPTALAVVTPSTRFFYADPRETEVAWENSFEVRHLERFPPGTPYIEAVMRTQELRSDRVRLPRSEIVVNTSSSGPEPLKAFRDRGVHPRAFTILNGEAGSWRGDTRGVSKRVIVGATVRLMQEGRMKVAEALDLSQALVNELTTFRMRPVTSSDPIEATREGKDGDLVFAVGLACWWGDTLTWDDDADERMNRRVDGYDMAWDTGRCEITGY